MSSIVTFYSYKGGVGRSMVLANVATILSRWSFRTLIVDFDLEAPGLQYFFCTNIRNYNDLGEKKGILNILNEASNVNQIDWKKHLIKIEMNSDSNDKISAESNIDLLLAGNKGNESYLDELKMFNVSDFYKNKNGSSIIETLRKEWKENYDFILVDSRTGVTDIGGICTIQLPDILLTLFTANEQGWNGVKDISIKAIKHQNELPFERERLKVFPIPTRIDNSEKLLTDEWFSRFANDVGPLIGNWIHKDINLRQFLDKIFIPYVPYYSFGENLAVLDGTSNPSSMGYSIVNISSLIANNLAGSKDFFISRDEFINRIKLASLRRKKDVEELSGSLNIAKLVIIGESGVGKTTLVRKLLFDNKISASQSSSTDGIEVSKYVFKSGNNTYKLNIWDFGGQEIFWGTFQFFLTKGALYILVIDNRRDEFSGLETGLYNWIEKISILSENSPILIFENERGFKRHNIDIDNVKIKFPNVKGLISGDLSQMGSVDSLREAIEKHSFSLSHIGLKVPMAWSKIVDQIEQLNVSTPYLRVEKFFNICKKFGVNSKTQALQVSQFLHGIGIYQHFQDDLILKSYIFLKIDWITKAVYLILNDQKIQNRNKGYFDRNDTIRILNVTEYYGMYDQIIQLMIKFQTCYQISDEENDKRFLAPQLLPNVRPKYPWTSKNNIGITFLYEYMPVGLINYLIIRLHKFITNTNYLWKSGAIFSLSETKAEVIELYRNKSISIRVSGRSKKELMTIISSELDLVNAEFHGIKCEKMIPCLCYECSGSQHPYQFKFSELIHRVEKGRSTIECSLSLENVNITKLINELFSDDGSIVAIEKF